MDLTMPRLLDLEVGQSNRDQYPSIRVEFQELPTTHFTTLTQMLHSMGIDMPLSKKSGHLTTSSFGASFQSWRISSPSSQTRTSRSWNSTYMSWVTDTWRSSPTMSRSAFSLIMRQRRRMSKKGSLESRSSRWWMTSHRLILTNRYSISSNSSSSWSITSKQSNSQSPRLRQVSLLKRTETKGLTS